MSSFKAGNSTFKAPAAKSTRVRSAYMGDKDSAGVQSGLSVQSGFDSEPGPAIDNEKDSLTGNATERLEGGMKKSVSSKGQSFEIC